MNYHKYNGCTNREAIRFYEELESTLGQYTSGYQITIENEVYISYTLLAEIGRHSNEYTIEYDDFLTVLNFDTHQVDILIKGNENGQLHLCYDKSTVQDIRDILESSDCKYGQRLSLYNQQEIEVAEYLSQMKEKEDIA